MTKPKKSNKSASESKFNFTIKEIKRYKSKIDELISEEDINLLIKIKVKLESLQGDLKEAFLEIIEDNDFYYDQFVEAEDIVILLLSKVEAVVKHKNASQNDATGESKKNVNNNLKLPKFDLPHFNGDINKWLSFKEIFVTSIDKNESINPLLKFQYLFSALEGNAKKLLSGFPVSADSYKPAWETLIARYDNKRNLAHAQLSKFFNIKHVKSNQKSIFELLDVCNEAVRNLKCLNFEFNSFVDLILVFYLQNKFDESLRRQWELSLDKESFPTYEQITTFLEKQARSLQGLNESIPKQESKSSYKPKSYSNNLVASTVLKTHHSPCPECKEVHALHKCPEFLKLPIDQRWTSVKNKKLCVNCLRANHFASKCLITTHCKICKQNHHTLLHAEKSHAQLGSQSVVDNSVHHLIDNSVYPVNESNCLTSHTTNRSFQTLLSTAVIHVKTESGKFIPCKALIDSGSQKTLISEKCFQNLNLCGRKTTHRICGVNNIVAENSLLEADLIFSPYFNQECFKVEALVVKQITTKLPNFSVPNRVWPHLEGLTLADPQFYLSSEIDVLIGADLFAEIILGQSILGPKGSPNAISSRLGWLLSGVINSKQSINKTSIISCHATMHLEEELHRFWELESIPNSKPVDHSEEVYAKTVTRTESGRYMVDLPFKTKPIIGNSESAALRRFHCLESKLQNKPQIREQYSLFMKEYLDLNHMELVPPSEIYSHENYFYLPHHGVLKEDSTTTKLRVVFDASATNSEGYSLNDFLDIGPKLQPDLFRLLVKFRTYPVALSADIEKMYRQILINPKHAEFQRIFWRFSPQEAIQTYRLLTVTYGTSCAPFLAIRTLHQLAQDNKELFPNISKVILENFFVDDLLSGSHSIEEAKSLVSGLNQVMKSGGFTLRKWSSNVSDVIADLPEELKSNAHQVNIQNDTTIKILGLIWNSSKDILKINIVKPKPVFTKRQLLSVVASIFDPLGFLSPTTICLKIMMQELWKDKIAWDEPISNKLFKSWTDICSQLDLLNNIEIPRYMNILQSTESRIQLHGFCDGSSKAFSAVVYLRVINSNGDVHVSLIASKTRVTPLKHVTLPRIELCSALLLAQLCAAISESLPIRVEEIFLWSDSNIAISWIKSPPSKGNQFVLNRVTQIKSLIPYGIWHHIPGKSNPADCASRGISPKTLLNHSLWWTGPPWLSSNQSIPTSSESNITSFPPEEIFSHVTNLKQTPEFLVKFSSFQKLIRVVAYVMRFIHNLRHSEIKKTGPLSVVETNQSTRRIVQLIQEVEYQSEITMLKKGTQLPKSSKILSLSPFLDKEGILRVGGRLSKHSTFTPDQKHPMLLPKYHYVTQLIVTHLHITHLHAGPQLVLSLLRQQFWIPNGRTVVRKFLHACLTCFKLKSKPSVQLMGDLPPDRITLVRPFLKIGIDFAGPFLTKSNLPRSRTRFKSYLCLIICMATKAVHLELVSSLSTSDLLAALRRFISRRGSPTDIYSDNAKNFKGAAKHLKELFKLCKEPSVHSFCLNQKIQWHFIPPYSPNFGGLWEASIKIAKNHLTKSCKAALLSFEELSTLLCEVEACINSRPLTPLSSDPSDLSVLTPGHFLIGSALLDLPDVPAVPRELGLSPRWKLIQDLRHHFWRRWSLEYLHNLQSRAKWVSSNPNLQTGDLVLIHDTSLPPLAWMVGRISKTILGRDGKVRVASVSTKKGELLRSISKLSPLPLDTDKT